MFNQCPKKFEYQYIQKIGEWVSSEALDKGKLVHTILEYDGDIQKIKNSGTFKEVQENKILTKEKVKECFQIFKDFKSSKIGQWLQDKESLFDELPIGMNKDLEIVDYNSNEVIFRGYIDKVAHDNDTLIIIDYKTGKFKADMPFTQLLYYGIALFSKLPFDNILVMNIFVEHNKFNKLVLKREDIERYKTALFTNINTIEDTKVFNKNETALCNWCPLMAHCHTDFETTTY